MKIISKVIVWILSIIFLFVVINLGIGLFKYKSISNYADFLNQKDRYSTLAQIDITNPISIFSIFYGEYISVPKDVKSDDKDSLDLIQDEELEIQEEDGLNVYDPSFEDDFNEFFGTTHTGDQSQKPEYGDAGFVLPEETSDQNIQTGKTVGQELLERFSQ